MKLINGHLNTIYSFMNSAIQPQDFLDRIRENNCEYFSITERNNFFSLGYFLQNTQNSNLKPIFGLDLDLILEENKYRYILYPQNKEGLIELYKISHKILSNQDIYLKDVILIKNIFIVEHPLFGKYALTKDNSQTSLFSNYYFSFQYDKLAENEDFIAKNLNKCLIINHNVILDITENWIINILNHIENRNEKMFFEELQFDYEPKNQLETFLINQTNDFFKKCYIEFDKKQYVIPSFKNDENLSSIDYLKKLLAKNIKQKFSKETFTNVYSKRVSFEFDIIKKLKFEDYFLIIQDWVNWAKSNNIAIGPGRGSAAGSLICYLLNITEVDPIKHGLIFERFLNPDRVSMPDIDIDVQDNRRDEIIEYLINKYGFEYVASIVTFSSLGKKSAIRDVLRAYEISTIDINIISKSISNKPISLKEEYKTNKYFANALQNASKNDEAFASSLVDETSKLEGFYRQTGTHAAGIIIGHKKLTELIPTYVVDNNMLQTQISMEYLESFGLIKMDILGLKTLTTIKDLVDYINANKKSNFNLNQINYNDKLTFELLSTGNTIGIFQLEGYGMINAIRKIGISNFEDIVAIISLFRPGPMENIDEYAKRKQGKSQIPKVNDKYDAILANTYGVIVYQEQIMQIVQTVANMSFSQADLVRRAISKKDLTQMHKIKQEFIDKAVANHYSLKEATLIYDNIEKFADYGFNKSHAVAYATIAYQMAYLKAHFPLEFYASIISSAHGTHETIAKYVAEAQTMGIHILSPDINLSDSNAVIHNGKIILPFTMIKGIGPETVKQIVNNRREYGPYKDFEHFMIASSLIKQFGKSTIELLIKASVFRNFDLNQKSLLNAIDDNSNLTTIINVMKDTDEHKKLLKNYKPKCEIEKLSDDYTFDANNENELLGDVYNFSLTKKYEIEGQRLIDLHLFVEYVIYVYCSGVMKKQTSQGRTYYLINLQDSTQKISFAIYDNKLDYLQLNKKIVKVKLIKKEFNRYILKDWKFI